MPRLAAASPADARRPSPLSALLLSLAALAAGCGESEHPLRAVERGEAEVTGQGVLVVVVDGLRWDHTSLAGYDRETTPFLARFSEQCAVFANAWTPVASLLGAHVGLLSGADPALAVPPPAAGGEAASRRPLVVPRALGLVVGPAPGARVHLAGPRDDAGALLAASDALVHLARSEAGGAVLLEALSAGVPVVATDVCGYAPWVAASGAGAVLRANVDAPDAARALVRVLSDHEMPDRALSFVDAHPELFTMHARIVDALERAAEERRGR
ncbi:MAG: glycosyltransferase [Planctomycetota bacterium]